MTSSRQRRTPRFFHAKTHSTRSSVADCTQSEAGTFCDWKPTASHDTVSLRVGYFDGGGVLKSTEVAVFDGAAPVKAGRAAVDPTGAVHLAWYAEDDSVGYVRLTSAAP